MKKIFRFLLFLLICALCFNCITFLALSYRKADQSYIDECARKVRTKFKTTMTIVNEIPEAASFKERLINQREYYNNRETKDIPAGTNVKVLAVYRKALNGKYPPRYYNIYSDWLIELPDGTRGYAQLPEACIGMRCKDNDGNELVIKDIRKRNAEKGGTPYVLYMEGRKQSYEFKDLIILHDKNSRGYAWPVFTENPGLAGLSISLGKGFFSYPFIIDLFVIPYWLRLLLGIFGILFSFIYIPVTYFSWLSEVSLKPLYNDRLTEREATRKASRRHAIGWWAFFILTGSIINPVMWIILWAISGWNEELETMLKVRCPKCNKMGVEIRTSGFKRTLSHTSVENFNETKTFENGIYSYATDKERKYLQNSGNRQSLTFNGRRRMYHWLSTWTEHYTCPFCGYTADKKCSDTSIENGEILGGNVTRTTTYKN